MFNKEKRDEIKILDCDTAIVSSDRGIMIKGNLVEILQCYSMLTRELNKGGIDKELLDHSYKVAFMSDKELEKETMKEIKKLFEKINKEKSEKNE